MKATAAAEAEAAWRAEGVASEAVRDAYRAYARRFGGGGAVFGGALLLFAAAQASLVATDCWLARWSSLPAPQQEDVALNLGVLAALAALAALLVGVQAAAWPLLCLRASATMHAEAVRAVLRAPMAYHTATPSGRLVARFSKDVDALDASLPSMLAQAFTCAAALLASLATIVASAPLVAPAVAVAALALIRIVAKYRPTAGEAKRLVSVLHGPIVSLLLEGLGGREYLRAYCQQHAAADEAVALLEASARAQTFNIALQRWLALRLEALGAAILLCVSLLCVGARGRVPLGLSGLSLTYSMTLTNLAKYLVNYATRADAQFASFDRVQALTAVKSEASAADGDGAAGGGGKAAPPREWPTRGEVVFDAYVPAPYAPHRAPPLQPLTLTLSPHQHVAVVGRSGAGKSTFVAALARLLPLGSGRMAIDGWDASDVALARWRRGMRAIPQEPLLLATTLERNLDPDCEYSAEAHADALRLAGLEGFVRALPRREQTEIGAGGVRVSAGQLQLIVLARLLLHRHSTRLVLLDEPAAQMEHAASARLHGVLHESFGHACLVAVTHRLLPLAHLFGRVLVFADGACVEDGATATLLAREGSQVHQQLRAAPARLQAHVRRMQALHKMRGLSAVRGLWQSANLPTPTVPEEPAAEAAATRGTDSPPLTPRSAPISAAAAAASAPGGRRGWKKQSFVTRVLPWSSCAAAPELPAAAGVGGAVGGLVLPASCAKLAPPTVAGPAAPIVGEPAPPASMMGRRLRRAGSASSFSTRELPWSVLED